LPVEHTDRDKLGARTLLANRSGNGGSMPDAIDPVVGGLARSRQVDSAAHFTDMRMTGVDSAVENRDGDAGACPSTEWSVVERETHDSCQFAN
jgi:hypothetical protein